MSDDNDILTAKQRRLRVLEEQKAQFGNLCPPHITTEIEDLQREIAELTGSITAFTLPRPPQPDFVHPYPLQASFTGRVSERKLLTGWLAQSSQPILALIAIGGMGKSALTWAWVQRDVLGLPLPGATEEPPAISSSCRLPNDARPEGVLWWSFYETQASFAAFLDEAIGYASDRKLNPRDLPSTYDKGRVLLNLLQERRLLLVLDGFERELRAYASLGAVYQGDTVAKDSHGEHHACGDPHTSRFLRDAATLPLKSRILLTSRLFSRELDDLAGCWRIDLAALDLEDVVAFFKAQGIRGTRAEIQAASAPYGYHALALRLLAGVIKKNKRDPGDIKIANRYPLLPALKGKEQHHILQVAYDELEEPKRVLLSRIAAFRNPVPYELLTIFNENSDEQRFEAILDELQVRGLLFFDDKKARYDLHPVVRSYSYDRLTDKTGVHTRLRDYFVTRSQPSQIRSMDDLAPVIELYHHTIGTGQYDEAWEIYNERLRSPLFYQFGQYELDLQLLMAVPYSDDGIPLLSFHIAQIWTLIYTGMYYEKTGNPTEGLRFLHKAVQLSRQHKHEMDLSAALVCYSMSCCDVGRLASAEIAVDESTSICDRVGHINWVGISHRSYGRILMVLGDYSKAFDEFKASLLAYGSQLGFIHGRSAALAYQAQTYLWQNLLDPALELAKEAYELSCSGSFEREEIAALWLIGTVEAIIGERPNAEKHLHESLIRCRRINLVELEPDILLSWAKWHRLQGNSGQAHVDAKEALSIADRCEYRLKQADIHNFLAQLALDEGNRAEARRHAETAKERAWCDGPPHCYKPALDEAERLLRETSTA